MNQHFHFSPSVSGLLLIICLLGACGGPKHKTQEQIKEDYHKYLITPDLTMCELMGNVQEAEYPNGFLQQYVPDLPAHPDTVFFMPDGISGFHIVMGNDSLLCVRGTGGELIGFQSNKPTGNKLNCHYADDRNVDYWAWYSAAGDSLIIRFKKEGRQISSFSVEGHKNLTGGTIKNIHTDDLGNWTERTITTHYADGTTRTQSQTRKIKYY